MHSEATGVTAKQCRHTDYHIPSRMNQSPGGNGSSTSCPSFQEHQITNTFHCKTSNRLRGSSHETPTASTQHGLSFTMHHTTRERGPSSYGSHGRRHRQTTQLPPINAKHKIQKTWSLSLANEFGRLANGIGGRIKNPTNTIEFTVKHAA
jgi:hypothetical protein